MTREQFRSALLKLISDARDAELSDGFIASVLETQLDLINEENDGD